MRRGVDPFCKAVSGGSFWCSGLGRRFGGPFGV